MRASRTPYGCIVSTIDGMIVSDESQRSQMTVYIAKQKTQSPPKYHTSANCPMVQNYRNAYKAVSSPPPGYTPCQRMGPCRG
jgi:hypothetical protein